MHDAKINLNFGEQEIQWFDSKLPFHPRNHWKQSEFINAFLEEEPIRVQALQTNQDAFKYEFENDSKVPLPSKFEKMDTNIMVDSFTHLDSNQRSDLKKILNSHPDLFSGKIGNYTSREFHFNIDHNAKSSFKSHYPCALKIQPILKDELDRLEEIKIIEKMKQANGLLQHLRNLKRMVESEF